MFTLEELLIKITTNSDDVKRDIDGVTDHATKKSTKFSRVGAAVFGAWQRVGMKAVDTVFSAVNSNMDGAIKRFDTLNNFTNVMTSIGFGAEEADAAINGLADGIEKLPTTLDAVARQAQMIAPITNDIGEAKDITLALNNALAAGGVAGAEAEGAITQWVQAMAKGKPDYTEWMRLVQSSPAQMDQLAKSILGAEAGQADLWASMKEGTLTIEDLNEKMVELSQSDFEIDGKKFDSWAKQAEKASAGIQMATLNVKAAIQRNIANVLKAVNEQLGGSGIADKIQSIVPAIDKVGESFRNMISGDVSFEQGMTSLLDSAGKGLRNATVIGAEFVTNLMKGMAKAAPGLVETATKWVGRINSAIATVLPSLIASGAQLIGGLITGFASGLPRMIDGAVSIIQSLGEVISTNAESFISNGLDVALDISEKIRSGARKLVSAGLELVKNLAKGIANSLPVLIQKLPTIVTNIAGVINDNAPKILAAGVSIIVTLAKGLIQALPTLIANLPQIIAAIWNAFTAVNWLALGKQVLTAIGSGIKAVAKNIPDILKNIGSKAWNALKGLSWKNLGSTVLKLIGSGISALVNFVPNLLKSIASKGMQLFTGVGWGNVGKNVVTAIARGITATISTVITAVQGMIDKIKDMFPFNIGKIFSGKVELPKLSVTKDNNGGASTSMTMREQYFAKAMAQPYLFTKKTLFNQYAGEAGDEVLYGRSALMRDIEKATGNRGGDIIINLNYSADADATDMLRDLSRGVQRYRMAGAI